MTIYAPAAELEHSYESLRAQALGEIPTQTPRGLAVFLGRGMCAWMYACAPLPPSTPMSTGRDSSGHDIALVGAELVQLLAEMVLSGRLRCYA